VSRFKLAPSILAADFGQLAEEARAAEAAGADWLHLDVMDGHFVPNLTIGPDVVAAIAEASSLPMDVHLMVSDPDLHIPAFADAGATALGVHVEACTHLHRTLELIRARDVRTCVVLNPATPASSISEVLPLVDQVLVMTVNPGFGGQKFIKSVMPKLYEIRRQIELGGREIDLTVDGGVDLATVTDAATNGANVFVMGSAFFRCEGKDYKRLVDQVRSRLEPFDIPSGS
jgi:ribulose-phosphate 3-epimerase